MLPALHRFRAMQLGSVPTSYKRVCSAAGGLPRQRVCGPASELEQPLLLLRTHAQHARLRGRMLCTP